MGVFAKLQVLRAFEKRHLDCLETLEDYDLVREIGYHQERGTPLTMKSLYLLNVASVATIQRRLRRLRQLGAIQQLRTKDDARAVELRISPALLKTFTKYGELLAGSTTGS
jgi:hypothetical protein